MSRNLDSLYKLFHVIKLGISPVYQIFLNVRHFTYFSLLITGLTITSIAFGQNSTIDSLKSKLSSEEDNRFEVLFELARQHIVINENDVALDYADQALKVSLLQDDSLKIVKANRIKGAALRRLEYFNETIGVASYALAIAKRNGYREEVKYLLNTLALVYTNIANYDKALDYNFQSLVVRESEGDKSEISITLNNIGFVYFKLKNYERALEYFNRSLLLKKEVNDTYDLDHLLINIGISYIHLKNFQDALKSIDQAFQACGGDCANDIIIEGEFGLGVANFGLEDFEVARRHFQRSLEIASKVNNMRFQAENLVYLGRVEINRRNFENARIYLTNTERIADSLKYNQLLIDAYKEFSRLYTLSEKYQEASIYQNKYIALKDSLIGEELVKNIAKIQTQFEERENIATIQLKEEDLVRQRNLNIAIGIIAMLAALLGFVLYRSNLVTRRVNADLTIAKGVIEKQNKRLQDINRELDGKVKEKTANLEKAVDDLDKANKSLSQVNDELDNFIYKTSHDIRGPLASLKGICGVALLDVKDTIALNYLTKLDVSADRLNVILTRLLIVNQINNAVLNRDQIDFNVLVDEILLLERKKGLPSKFQIKRDIQDDVTLESDTELVRLVLENLIDNAIKFYNDSDRVTPFVHIKIYNKGESSVSVSVIDNGIGVTAPKPEKIFQIFSRGSERSETGGVGLYLSKLATEKLGGTIQLQYTPEGYTEFYVSLPSKLPELIES